MEEVEAFMEEGDHSDLRAHVKKAKGAHGDGSTDYYRMPMCMLGRVDPAPSMDRLWAQAYLPCVSGVTMVKDVVWHFRWVGGYQNKPTKPYYFSRSWKEDTPRGVLAAFKEVLKEVWLAHESVHPDDPCTHAIDSIECPP